MNDDPEDELTESELRVLRPAPVSERLAGGVSERMADPGLPLYRPAWWQRLGFTRPKAALGWGLASPAMAVAVTLMAVHLAARTPLPSPRMPNVPGTGESAAGSADDTSINETRHATAANVLHGAFDEGIVPDGDNGLARRVLCRSTDHVQWRNPHTGAQWEVSYPREDVLLVPINAE